jgi:hypothetical protein
MLKRLDVELGIRELANEGLTVLVTNCHQNSDPRRIVEPDFVAISPKPFQMA